MISVVDEKGETVFKIVAGCDGSAIGEAVKALQESKPRTLNGIYNTVWAAGMGCSGCLYVIGRDGPDKVVIHCGNDHKPGQLYATTFADPRFNAPSTAKFQPYDPSDVDRLQGNTYRAEITVDAENSFGAMLRGVYRCETTWISGETWRMDKIEAVK